LAGFEASSSANADITKNVTFVFRHFPLFQIHPNAYAGSYAAEAAGKQGKFWEMHDLLYETQVNWASLPNPTDFFVNLAAQLKLDVDKFKADMNSQAVKDKVDADLRSGNAAAVNSTPTFFYNGKKLTIQSFDQLTQILRTGSN
jgi:protein-disulfide isomerase